MLVANRHRLTAAVAAALFSATVPAFAQEAAQTPPAPAAAPAARQEAVDLDKLVVTGTRVQGRSPTESMSPVDVFRPADLEKQASADFTDQLANIAPSFNTQRFPIADGTAFVRPANLRNLPPDQTLVLINGKRRHRSALVNLQVEPFGTVNQGSQAVDYSLIPSAAIQRVEVLRDGSSAQYGSTYEGDGDKWRTSFNAGAQLGEGGFFNMTAEYFDSDHTSRGIPRADAADVGAFVGNVLVPFEGLGQRWGDPDGEGFRSFFNAEYAINENVSLYGFGSYADTEYDSSFFYRTPVGVPGVTPRGTLFVDGDGDGLADPVEQSIIDDIRARGLNPADYVTADATSPSGFIALNPIYPLFPGGYTPSFGAEITDYEGVFGARGETAASLRWDFSLRQGENHMIYKMTNSINPSLGRLSPTSFEPGDLTQLERGANADFVWPWQNDVFATPVNVAFGAEWREETYKIRAGDTASWANGPTGALFGVGSDGFQGDSPEAAGDFSQYSRAAYVDLETDVVEHWTVGVAGRYEDTSNFDSTFDWKVSTRFAFTDTFAVRATVNTGFRTPTPGQLNTLDVTTTADSSGNLVPLGTFPVASEAAIALGAQPLDAEESFAYSAGLVWTPTDTFSLTLDYYNIEVDDRLALQTINITPGSPEQQALIDAGVPGAALLGQVSYFVNGFDSKVQGVDLVAVYRADFGNMGSGVFDFRHSYNKQEVDSVAVVPGTTTPVIDAERVADLENQLPNNRSVITFDWRSPWNVNFTARANYYDSWEDFTFGEKGEFGSEWLFDLSATVSFMEDKLHVTVGGNNVFDNYPDRETNSTLTFLGAKYPLSSPFGFNGGEWYVRATYEF